MTTFIVLQAATSKSRNCVFALVLCMLLSACSAQEKKHENLALWNSQLAEVARVNREHSSRVVRAEIEGSLGAKTSFCGQRGNELYCEHTILQDNGRLEKFYLNDGRAWVYQEQKNVWQFRPDITKESYLGFTDMKLVKSIHSATISDDFETIVFEVEYEPDVWLDEVVFIGSDQVIHDFLNSKWLIVAELEVRQRDNVLLSESIALYLPSEAKAVGRLSMQFEERNEDFQFPSIPGEAVLALAETFIYALSAGDENSAYELFVAAAQETISQRQFAEFLDVNDEIFDDIQSVSLLQANPLFNDNVVMAGEFYSVVVEMLKSDNESTQLQVIAIELDDAWRITRFDTLVPDQPEEN